MATLGMVVFSTLVSFPYPATSMPARALAEYSRLQAELAGAVLRHFDPTVSVQRNVILGRYALRIVLDCSALDVQGLFLASVLAFPAKLRSKALGALFGMSAIAVVNLGRIVALYLVGLHFPQMFDVLHEEVFQIVILAAALTSFGVWALGPLNRSAIRAPA